MIKIFIRFVPASFVYLAGFELLRHATMGKYSSQEVPALKMVDALDRWYEDRLKKKKEDSNFWNWVLFGVMVVIVISLVMTGLQRWGVI